jgi:acyl carrier protein
LVAYVVPKAGRQINKAEMRTFAAAKMPPYMVPSELVVLESMPLTANGKVDHRALPSPESVTDASRGEIQEPGNDTEKGLLKIWRELLGREAFGTQDNFFHLGGHSLLATQVISRVGKAFGVELPVRAIFEAPTVSGLAREISEAQRTGSARAPEIRSRGAQSRAADLLARLDELSDEEVEALLQETDLNQL